MKTVPSASEWLQDRGFKPERTLHRRHWEAWRVEIRPAKNGYLTTELQRRVRFKAIPPTDPSSDYVDIRMFDTFDEAITYAQREAFKAAVIEKFSELLEDDEFCSIVRELVHEFPQALQQYADAISEIPRLIR